MAVQLLGPIDLTGEPTVWAFQELQFWDALKRVWRRQPYAPLIGPAQPFRVKLSDLNYWEPRRAWPDYMARGGYRAKLSVLHAGNQWQPLRIVEGVPHGS